VGATGGKWLLMAAVVRESLNTAPLKKVKKKVLFLLVSTVLFWAF
jgi:hypothetical protein